MGPVGCNAVSVAGSTIIGAICGVCLTFSVPFVDKVLHIDDPVGAVSVHGICGALGTILTGLFSTTTGLFYGHGWKLLGIQSAGVLAVISWAFACGFVLFFILKKWKGIRVAPRIEEDGLDIYEHGETAYNN